MAGKGLIANLKPWKPGQSGNIAGRASVLPPEIRKERKQNQSKLIKMVTEFFGMTDKDAEERFEQPETTQLEKAVQAVIGKAREGDVPAYRYLMELMVGKIPEHDYDGFTEEDLRVLNRVKEVFAERNQSTDDSSSGPVGASH